MISSSRSRDCAEIPEQQHAKTAETKSTRSQSLMRKQLIAFPTNLYRKPVQAARSQNSLFEKAAPLFGCPPFRLPAFSLARGFSRIDGLDGEGAYGIKEAKKYSAQW